MLPRHTRHLDRRLRPPVLLHCTLDIHERGFKMIECCYGCESFGGIFRGGEMGFCVWGGDYGQGAPERGFDGLVEVVALRGF